MSLFDVQISLDTYIAFALVLLTFWFYPTASSEAKHVKDRILSTFLLLHTLYMLYALLVSPPENIFKSLQVPLNVPSEHLYAKLVDVYGGERNVPPSLLDLPKRLGLMELRALYIRFGHEVIASCFHCQSSDDYALYAIPTPLLEYICEIAFIGILTLPRSSTAYLRPLGLGVLVFSLLTETYWTLTVQVTIPPFGNDTPATMWHDTFVQSRHSLFLILPLLITLIPHLGLHRIPILASLVPTPIGSFLPATQFQLQGHKFSIPANVTFSQMSNMTLQTLAHLLPTLHLLKYTHGAVMRVQGEIQSSSSSTSNKQHSPSSTTTHDEEPPSCSSPTPHGLATQWWAEEAREGHSIRTDKEVLRLLRQEGLISDLDDSEPADLPEGQLLLGAKMAVKMLKDQGSTPSNHWLNANANSG